MSEMIELEAPEERAILVGAPHKRLSSESAAEHLEELSRLVDTAGARIVGDLVQRIDSPQPRFYIGEGKVEELKALAEETEATLIVFDEELSPAQGKNLEDHLKVRVIDRAELILDIFATRARTAEAKMQVELAQLQYMLPRLTRMWVHLSRVRGGIGMRGPGETQLETDRRMINHRISRLEAELQKVALQRATRRKGREDVFKVALVGYTNAGKSSLLKALSGVDAFVEDRLFATLDAATRSVDLGDGYSCLLTDTVGFIRKLPHHLVASFRATLEEANEANLLLHVIDASHPGWEEQKEVVEEVLGDLHLRDHATILVFNKADRLTHEEEEALKARAESRYSQESVFVSAVAEGGVEPLRRLLRERLRAANPEVRLSVAVTEGAVLAEIYREGEVLERAERDGSIDLRVRLPAAALGRIRRATGVRIHGREE